MNFNNGIIIDIDLLKEFVYTSKMKAFAASASKTSLTDQTSLFSFRDFDSKIFGGYIYNDRYNGNIVEGGQESVSVDLSIIWRNQYYGGTIFNSYPQRSEITNMKLWSKFVTAFLKQALLKAPMEFPIRGPRMFNVPSVTIDGIDVKGDWKYLNTWEQLNLYDSKDPFVAFRGYEKIQLNDKEIFWHTYHGGLVCDKFFQFKLK